MAAKKGDKVTVDYTGTLADGTIFDDCKNHPEPLAFEAGSGQVIKGFDEAVLGMEEGQEKNITLAPPDAYGDPNPQLIKDVPRGKLPPDAKEGISIGVGLPNGVQLPAKIIKMDEKSATLDLNHPLAGKTLNFRIKLVSIAKK